MKTAVKYGIELEAHAVMVSLGGYRLLYRGLREATALAAFIVRHLR